MKILIAGELNVDLVLSNYSSFPELGREVLVEGASLTLGSSSAICAGALARLGNTVHFVGKAGRDSWGDLAIARLNELGVDTSAVMRPEGLTTGITVSISSSKDRAMVTYPGSIEALRAGEVSLACDARHLHVSSYYLQRSLRPGLRGLFARAHAAGWTTSLDPGCDPAGEWDRAGIVDALTEVDLFFPNEVELGGIGDVRNGRTLVVAKLGSAGAEALGVGKQAAFPIVPVDTTGAGDCFNAGFLHHWLRHRSDIAGALRFGAACGALSTQAAGGTGALPGEADVLAFLR